MSILTIALLQMAGAGMDQEANRLKGDAFCRRAASLGADIALFPEMWNVGYTRSPTDAAGRAAWAAAAAAPDDPFVAPFRALARALDMAIAVTYLERWPGRPRNAVSVIDRRGAIVLTYAKVHTCDFDWEAELTAGEEFPVCALDTAGGTVQVGAMICYDREFPESARMLMLHGAEIILVPNACDLGIVRLTQLRARATENMVGVALANYAAPEHNGHSVAYDGVAFDAATEAELDTTIVEAGAEEGVYLARFDLARLRAYRERESWGNAYRRPRLYCALVSPEVRPPFVRPDARR